MKFGYPRSRDKQGYVLMAAVAATVILASVVGALHQYEVVTRRALSGDEADILLVQARKWEMAKTLHKIPGSLKKPADIIVATGAIALANDLYTPENCGQNMFLRDGEGTWNGLPNLVVTRLYKVDPAAAALPAPPNFKEFRGTPTSRNASYQVYAGRNYRHMTGDFLRVAALAPAGSIRLDGCAGWSNPDMDDVDVKAEQRYSGIPVIVAAGTTASVARMTYGTIYAGKGIAPVMQSSMVTPLIGPLPISSQIPARLIEQAEAAKVALAAVAAKLDNKTQQISGSPPTLSNLAEMIFVDAVGGDGKAVQDKLLGWLSIRSAAEFPYLSIPGFATAPFPGTYVSFQVWFHTPFAPDTEGLMANAAQSPSQMAKDWIYKISRLQIARSTVDYMQANIRGGGVQTKSVRMGEAGNKIYEPSGGYDSEGNPIGEWKQTGTQTGTETSPKPKVNPGLKPRSTALLENLQEDLKTLERAKAEGSSSLVTSGLKTDQSLLTWMADYQAYLYDDTGQVPQTGVDSNLAMGIDKVSYDLKASPPSPDEDIYRNDAGYPMLNNGVLRNAKSVFPPLKDKNGAVITAGGAPVRDSTQEPTSFFGDVKMAENQLKSGDPISATQWKTILGAAETKNGQGQPALSDLDRQLEFFRFLNSKTDTDNPFNKVGEIESKLDTQAAAIDRKKTDLTTAIEGERAIRLQGLTRLSGLPKTRKEERHEKKFKSGVYSEFPKGKGLQGFSFWRYGYSYDMIYNVIAYLADSSGDQDSFWTTFVPMVWWGEEENNTPIAASNGLDVKATFTVPQTRTFYYENPVTIRGDLWLQRGATMVVARGDLRLQNPYPLPVGMATKYLQGLNFLPSGRIFLEEGANLVVLDGNVYCAGPVIVTSQPYTVRPITSSIICPKGDVVLRHGVFSGLGFTDILQSKDLQGDLGVGADINKYFVYPLFATVFPNMGKVYPLGPFHKRLCHFAKNCSQYRCDVFIGPFGIPIPIVMPWPVPRNNANVTLYRGLSWVYAIASNIHLGENLYPQCDWWPFQLPGAGIGVVPIFPKLNVKAYGLDAGLTKFFKNTAATGKIDTQEFAKFILAGLNQLNPADGNSAIRLLIDQIIVDLLSRVLSEMLPSPFNMAVSGALSVFESTDDSASDKAAGPYANVTDNLGAPFTDINGKIVDLTGPNSPSTFENALLHEVAGALVYGRRIFVGYDIPSVVTSGALKALPVEMRPLLAGGLFLATGDINMNAEYTVGAIVTSGGSINPDAASRTELLFYPGFTRASLYQPGDRPVKTDYLVSNYSALPYFLARALDLEYGVMQSGNPGHKGLDVYVEDPHVTAEGWDQ